MPKCPVKILHYFVQGQGQWMLRISINVCSDDIFWTTEPFVTKLGIVKHLNLESQEKKYIFSRSRTYDSYNQNTVVSVISSELLIFLVLLPNFVWWYIIIGWSVLWNDCFAVFKVKITFQNFITKTGWMFVWTVSSELLNLLKPNLVWWCIVMSQSVLWKDCVAIFKVKVIGRACISKYDCFH